MASRSIATTRDFVNLSRDTARQHRHRQTTLVTRAHRAFTNGGSVSPRFRFAARVIDKKAL